MKQPRDRRLLAVLAHPDDETFGMGGTLALYAQHGVEVHLICATCGEAGDVPPELLHGYSDIGQLRIDELHCAAACLGLADLHLLGYRDSGMPGSPDNQHPEALIAAPLDEVAATITTFIRQIRPQVIITFDPLGVYRHPDHIAIHHATLAAFRAAGDPSRFPDDLPAYQPQKLYYYVISRRLLRLLVLLLPLLGRDPHRWGRNADVDLVDIASYPYTVHAQIDLRPVADIKCKAAACYRSQSGPPTSRVINFITRLIRGREMFMRAYPPPPKRLRERDLFEGVINNTIK